MAQKKLYYLKGKIYTNGEFYEGRRRRRSPLHVCDGSVEWLKNHRVDLKRRL